MPILGRADGEYLSRAPALRRLMPHLMPGRNESVAYFEQQLVLSRTLEYLKKRNDEVMEGEQLTLFHVVLAAVVRTLGVRPQLNRFVVGRRLYQRNEIALSFVVKKAMTDEAGMTTVKIVFDPADTLGDVVRRVNAAVAVGRGTEKTSSEKEMAVVTRLPRSLLRLALWLQRVLDYFNLLPRALTQNDPLYASVFLANLGSIGLDAPFHHLYEYGTVSLFAALGKVQKAPIVTQGGALEVRDVVKMNYSFDERICDGFYAARSLELLKSLVEDPARLEAPPSA